MGFFSNLTRSWKKSSRLRELQLKIAPPGRGIKDMVSDLRRSLDTGTNERERALEEFLDLCETDEGVKETMKIEDLSRTDLKQLYIQLSVNGLGQWVKGHYAALSTVAYAEPLQYAVRARKRGTGLQEIAFNLLEYWEDKIPQGGLLRRVQ
jgi:ATP phosphoribosyltransferase regulatory subunit HisZ